MSFRLVPKSVTLNDRERRPACCVISPNLVARRQLDKPVKVRATLSAKEM